MGDDCDLGLFDHEAAQTQLLELIDGSDVGEEPVHQFLVRNPGLLLLHPRVVGDTIFTKPRLGSQHTVDFAYATVEDSIGVIWWFIEIESPWRRRFTKSGDPSAAMLHGIRQIRDWQVWLTENRDYFRRNFAFADTMKFNRLAEHQFTLVIGRREGMTDQTRGLLEGLMSGNFRIISYDNLLERGYRARTESGALKMCSFANGQVKTLTSVRTETENRRF